MKRRNLILGLAVMIVFSLTACKKSSNEESTSVSKKSAADPSKEKVELVESGYHISKSYSDKYLYYAATLKNPNTKYTLEFPKIIVTAKNKDGSILAYDEQVLNYIVPGDKVSFASILDCKGKTPDQVEIRAESGNYIPRANKDTVPTNTFKVLSITETKGDLNEYSYIGEIENSGEQDVSSVLITILLKKNGKLVGGTTTFLDNLDAGSKKVFEISEYDLPEHDEYVVSGSSWE